MRTFAFIWLGLLGSVARAEEIFGNSHVSEQSMKREKLSLYRRSSLEHLESFVGRFPSLTLDGAVSQDSQTPLVADLLSEETRKQPDAKLSQAVSSTNFPNVKNITGIRVTY